MYMIKEMPNEARPRERLYKHGAHVLSNEELIAILLRTGHQSLSVIDLSKSVVYHLESINDLKKITLQEMMQIKGIKLAKAATLLAAIELGKRLAHVESKSRNQIHSPYDIYEFLHQELLLLEQEHFIAIYLNTKGHIIKKETVFIGTINQMIIHPREIFKHAVRLSAAAVIFVHNHPSGDSSPSNADFQATDKLMKTSEIIGIDVIDHIIIGKNEFYSIKQQKKTYL
jgi:DNA repair protein RadC